MFKFSELFKHSTKYPDKIQEIHKTVDMSSDKALAEAREILFNLEKVNDTKAERLLKLGFTGIDSVRELNEMKKEKERFKQIRDCIESYQRKYPFNKFITKQEANAVCEKYNLYIGDVPFFKGFVPERNLQEMERFVSNYSITEYYKRPAMAYFNSMKISREEYLNYKDGHAGPTDQNYGYSFYEHTPIFKIMAPETQFYIAPGMRKVGREIIDDPIVLLPVSEGYIVITAWGDEASDPIVVNEGNN